MNRFRRWLRRWFSSLYREPGIEVHIQIEEAEEAREKALRALRALEQQEVEARAVSVSLRHRREEGNHFGELLIYAMRRRAPRKT